MLGLPCELTVIMANQRHSLAFTVYGLLKWLKELNREVVRQQWKQYSQMVPFSGSVSFFEP